MVEMTFLVFLPQFSVYQVQILKWPSPINKTGGFKTEEVALKPSTEKWCGVDPIFQVSKVRPQSSRAAAPAPHLLNTIASTTLQLVNTYFWNIIQICISTSQELHQAGFKLGTVPESAYKANTLPTELSCLDNIKQF